MLLLNQTQTLISIGKKLVFKKKNVVWALVAGVGLHPVGRGRPESLLQQFCGVPLGGILWGHASALF